MRKKTAVVPKGTPSLAKERARRMRFRVTGKTKQDEVERRRVAKVAAYLLQAIRSEQ